MCLIMESKHQDTTHLQLQSARQVEAGVVGTTQQVEHSRLFKKL